MNNVIDFQAYKDERARDNDVKKWLADGMDATWLEDAPPDTQDRDPASKDLAMFTERWLVEFNTRMDDIVNAVREAEEVIHDVDKMLGDADQEEPLR